MMIDASKGATKIPMAMSKTAEKATAILVRTAYRSVILEGFQYIAIMTFA